MTETSTSTDVTLIDMVPDTATVLSAMTDIATREIMPRFKALADHEIIEKRPGDLVTAADHAAELAFNAKLPDLLPGSLVLGEEAFEANPNVMMALDGEEPVWIVDPVDGTHNFAHGETPFTVIVALAYRGDTLGGWIIDPVAGQAVSAVYGQGAFYHDPHDETLRLSPSTRTFDAARLVVGDRLRARVEKLDGIPKPICATRYRCVGREYMEIAMGTLDLARYGGRLKPWDHAAGCLIVREAGGVTNWLDNEQAYQPTSAIPQRTLGIAGADALWPDFCQLIAQADALTTTMR